MITADACWCHENIKLLVKTLWGKSPWGCCHQVDGACWWYIRHVRYHADQWPHFYNDDCKAYDQARKSLMRSLAEELAQPLVSKNPLLSFSLSLDHNSWNTIQLPFFWGETCFRCWSPSWAGRIRQPRNWSSGSGEKPSVQVNPYLIFLIFSPPIYRWQISGTQVQVRVQVNPGPGSGSGSGEPSKKTK